MFSRTASFVKTVPEWSALSSRRSADAAARHFAKRHMVAVMMRGDDSAVGYFYDVASDRVAKVNYQNPEWGL